MARRGQVSIARTWLPPLVIAVALASGATFIVSGLLPNRYEAEATLIIGTSLSGAPDYNELLASEQLAQTYATVATTRAVLDRVRSTLGLEETVDQLEQRLDAVAQPERSILTITASDGHPDRAALLANALVDALMAMSPGGDEAPTDVPRAIDRQLAAIGDQMEAAQDRLDELAGVDAPTREEQAEIQAVDEDLRILRETYAALIPFSASNAPNKITVLDPAVPPELPASPRPAVNAFVAAMAASLLVGSIAFMLEYPATRHILSGPAATAATHR